MKIELLVTIFCSIFGSVGFWSFIQYLTSRHSAEREMLLGLAYREISTLCKEYIEKGWISLEDLEDLYKYLYIPYRKLGGNGTGEKLMQEVDKLPRQPQEVEK